MPNVAIYPAGKDEITYFLTDAWQEGRKFISSDGRSVVVKLGTVFEAKWTDDLAERTPTGWSKRVSELAPVEGMEIALTDSKDVPEAMRRRAQLASLSYAQVENYIDANVNDLASAKEYLKVLSKVVLAVIKLQDKR